MVRLDFETRSTVDLRDVGVYPYAGHPDTDIICMAYAFGDEEPEIWRPDLPIPHRLKVHIESGGELHAWNAQFERVMWRIMVSRYGWPEPKLHQWTCSMALAATYGLPLSLDQACKALGTGHAKDTEGHNLMLRMCRPRRVDDDGKVVWWDDPAKLLRLESYCKQDVRTERDIALRLQWPEGERRVWLFDQAINDRGVGLDRALAAAAVDCASAAVAQANEELLALTDGRVSVTHAADMTGWLKDQGVPAASVAKASVVELLKTELSSDVRRVLEIRQESGRSSVAKFQKMLACASSGDRLRGLLQYHGAHTGRWAGRLVQPQNFPRGTVSDIESYIPAVLARNIEAIDLTAPTVEVLSSLLRSTLVPTPGKRFFVADFAAIEARVLAWLARQEDMLESFRANEDLYRQFAGGIYGVDPASIAKTSKERLLGKQAILGLGYQMGWKRFIDAAKSTYDLDVTPELAQTSVRAYRDKYSSIRRLWGSLEAAVVRAVGSPGDCVRIPQGRVSFRLVGEWLTCELPSGRYLRYHMPILGEREVPWSTPAEPEMKPEVTVMGLNSMTRKWERYALYGGLITENIVQAISRDLLVESMLRVEAAGYEVVLTVHDEVVAEALPHRSLKEFECLMREVPAWADGCPVEVEGWSGERYKK